MYAYRHTYMESVCIERIYVCDIYISYMVYVYIYVYKVYIFWLYIYLDTYILYISMFYVYALFINFPFMCIYFQYIHRFPFMYIYYIWRETEIFLVVIDILFNSYSYKKHFSVFSICILNNLLIFIILEFWHS